jgi:hypothetical protein
LLFDSASLPDIYELLQGIVRDGLPYTANTPGAKTYCLSKSLVIDGDYVRYGPDGPPTEVESSPALEVQTKGRAQSQLQVLQVLRILGNPYRFRLSHEDIDLPGIAGARKHGEKTAAKDNFD